MRSSTIIAVILVLLGTAAAHAERPWEPLAAKALGAGCTKDQTPESGSLHAQVAFDAPFLEPASKVQVSFTCGAKHPVLYGFRYKDAKDAANARQMIGAQLWGGPAPTAEHPDVLWANRTVVIIESGPSIGFARKALKAAGYATVTIKPAASSQAVTMVDVARTLACADKQAADFCRAVTAFADGKPLATASFALVGVSRSLVDAKIEVGYLVGAGGKAKYGTVRPDNKTEEQQTTEVLENVRKGKAPAATNPVVKYVKSLPASAKSPTSTTDGSTVFTTGEGNVVQARQTSVGVVVIETSPKGQPGWVAYFAN